MKKFLVLLLVCILNCGCAARSSEMITPTLDEEAIVKMSEEDLQYYGILVRNHCLQDVSASLEGTKISNDPLGGTNCCIGEFVSRNDEDVFLRRYYILIVFGDFDLFDEAVLIQYEWKVDDESITETVSRKELMKKQLPDG